MSDIVLEPKLVGDIVGNFVVASYQRGYRWDEEVKTLLGDLKSVELGTNYCLQPIVVKKIDDENYELIDGQQRLTSLLLILKFIKQVCAPSLMIKYSLEYKTRDGSKEFLDSLDFNNLPTLESAKNLDELFFIKAANSIKTWFYENNDLDDIATKLKLLLNRYVHVIWYQVDSSEDSVGLFTRLNIGKIPLTNAELVKALFLSRKNGISDREQFEIANQWDDIEKSLHNEELWGFITNEKSEKYDTKIELLFDLISRKQLNSRENFFTFYYFSNKISEMNNKKDLWTLIVRYYQHLKEWFEDRELYHKIGYLISTKSINLSDLIEDSNTKTKTQIRKELDLKIAESINFDTDYSELSYNDNYKDIEKLLLLFNVETVRNINDSIMKFPFSKHKNKQWSLEHIHAQQSEGLDKKKQWAEWLKLHAVALKGLHDNTDDNINLAIELEKASQDENLSESTFDDLFDKAINALTRESSIEYKHMLSNMALLGQNDNAALNNSTFQVKRNKILEMDKAGTYIPICTRRVFMKYYTPSDKNQLDFWGEEDRKSYIEAINSVLKHYLDLINREIKI